MESNKTATSLKIWWLGGFYISGGEASRVAGIAQQQLNNPELKCMLSEEDSFKRKAFIMSN